jgi:hypothetical protein
MINKLLVLTAVTLGAIAIGVGPSTDLGNLAGVDSAGAQTPAPPADPRRPRRRRTPPRGVAQPDAAAPLPTSRGRRGRDSPASSHGLLHLEHHRQAGTAGPPSLPSGAPASRRGRSAMNPDAGETRYGASCSRSRILGNNDLTRKSPAPQAIVIAAIKAR